MRVENRRIDCVFPAAAPKPGGQRVYRSLLVRLRNLYLTFCQQEGLNGASDDDRPS